MKTKHALIILPIIILLISICLAYPSISVRSNSEDYTIEEIHSCTDAKEVFVSGKHLYLQTNNDQIVYFYDEQYHSVYSASKDIYDFTANENILLYLTSDNEIVAINITGHDNGDILSTISSPSTGGVDIDARGNFVYTANQEHGFKVYNYTNTSLPQEVGSIPSSNNWHAKQVFIVSDTGFFSGDYSTGIYQFSNNHTNPSMLKIMGYGALGGSSKYSNVSLDLGGVPAVSDGYFVINHVKLIGDFRMFHIIPRMDSSLDAVYNVTYSVDKQYTDCFLVNNSVLVVASKGNTVTLFTITLDKDLDFLAEIDLQTTGKISHMIQVNDTNEFYIANEAGGLLKLTLNITDKPIATSFHFDLLMISLTVLFIKRRRIK
ncbi:MAG: hypothetical protein ACTSP4_11985 [Candidatus Hodarchaeales archaeon]